MDASSHYKIVCNNVFGQLMATLASLNISYTTHASAASHGRGCQGFAVTCGRPHKKPISARPQKTKFFACGGGRQGD